jgi:Ca2+:H+ antiporter
VNYAHVPGAANFIINFGAMIPLAGMMGFVTDQLAHYLGEFFGGLLLATFG